MPGTDFSRGIDWDHSRAPKIGQKSIFKETRFENFMLDRKMGLNWSPRGRKNVKIWHPEYFFIPDRLVGSPGAPGVPAGPGTDTIPW